MAKKLPMLTENNSPLIPFNSAALIQCLRASVVHVDPTTPIPGNQDFVFQGRRLQLIVAQMSN